MILLRAHLDALESHWAVAAVSRDDRRLAHSTADRMLIQQAVGSQLHLEEQNEHLDLLARLADAYEVAAVEGLDTLIADPGAEGSTLSKAGAYRSFEIRRVLPVPESDLDRLLHILRLSALAYAGERWADLRRWVFDHETETVVPNTDGLQWDQCLIVRIYEAWLRLFRKDSWSDLNGIATIVTSLREDQRRYESEYLNREDAVEKQVSALRLIALYHWAAATEKLATYMLQGQPHAIGATLDQHFDAAVRALEPTADPRFELLFRWLHLAARRMAAGSLWAATAGINSRVSRFVKSVTSASRPMVELLPPQRYALAEQGLLDPASKAVVIELPTSGGKTTLAQFRILQALNQFSQDNGWVAYVAPTKALVAQICRRLRRDFTPLGVNVEAVSGGIEIDSLEEDLLTTQDGFHVLVCTPEKLNIILRNSAIPGRPLALVVVDEAHNIEDKERGLRIELLLATIQRDCVTANFLLMMPFVPHPEQLARWLDPEAGKSISLGTTAWQPNERIVGLYRLVGVPGRGRNGRKNWAVEYKTLSTTPRTIHLTGVYRAGDDNPLNVSFTDAKSLSMLTVAMAKTFCARGTSVAVADTIPHVWGMARCAAANLPDESALHDDIVCVQNFLRDEIGPDFELVSLLSKRVAVHHAGLPEEAKALVEWLAEEGHLKILCATSTISQGINFPVSSVFLQATSHPTKKGAVPMTTREFWNLAGRAGRVGQDSLGVVGIATSTDEKSEKLAHFVNAANKDLSSRLIELIDGIIHRSDEAQLMAVYHDSQWADFRSYIAHLLVQAKDADRVISQADILLRSTFGYSQLRKQEGDESKRKADRILALTEAYTARIAKNMGAVALADSTGFDPEGILVAMSEVGKLTGTTQSNWRPTSMFGDGQFLAGLIGVMMKVPTLTDELSKLAGSGQSSDTIAKIAKAWVGGERIQEIALSYFAGDSTTNRISDACKGIQRGLVANGVWGLATLSKLPNCGIDWDAISDDQRREVNLLPALLYYGVDTESSVLMRMNHVPRSAAKYLGERFESVAGRKGEGTLARARDYVRDLSAAEWERARPAGGASSGGSYRRIWQILSGNT